MLGVGHPAIWIIAVVFGLGVGAAIGAFHGWLIAYVGIPSFIVTLGGLIVWRGAAWWVIRGETVAPMDADFQARSAAIGPRASIGASASWILGAIACAGIVLGIFARPQSAAALQLPAAADLGGGVPRAVGCAVALGATVIVNAYPWPQGRG